MVLMYHALDSQDKPVEDMDEADLSVVVDAENFRRQLQIITELNKNIVSLEELIDPNVLLPASDNVVLTFDDGHKSNYTLAFPMLIEACAVATFYVVADFVDKDPAYLTANQLRELASNNMLIGSHTHTHRLLPLLTLKEVRQELTDSRARLEDILGQPVHDLAIPGGHFNKDILEVAKECGYRSIATCKVGIHQKGDDIFRIKRVEIRRGLSLLGFKKTFARTKIIQLQILDSAKSCLRNNLGLSRYENLRRFAHKLFTLNR